MKPSQLKMKLAPALVAVSVLGTVGAVALASETRGTGELSSATASSAQTPPAPGREADRAARAKEQSERFHAAKARHNACLRQKGVNVERRASGYFESVTPEDLSAKQVQAVMGGTVSFSPGEFMDAAQDQCWLEIGYKLGQNPSPGPGTPY